MAFLNPDKISNCNGVTVKEYLLTNHNPNKIAMPTVTLPDKPLGITIHNTDWITTASGTNPSEQYSRATVNGNMKDVRVHYYVDNVCAWQNLPLTLSGWHAADGGGNGNRKTIAIECIMSSAYNDTDKKSEDNCAKLAAFLLHKYGLNVEDNLFTHTHWLNVRDGITGSNDYLNTRKHPYKWCPLYILPHWATFKAKVQQYLNALNNEVKALYTKTLNAGTPIYAEIGKSATGKIETTTKYTIVEEKTVGYTKYGKLKSGVGWVVVEVLKRTFNINNSSDVKELQTMLNAKGFNCGVADGIMGDKTRNAMFQALCELWLQVK